MENEVDTAESQKHGKATRGFSLAHLEPGWAEEPFDPRVKSSMRLQGNLTMLLRRPSRTPEHAKPYVPGDPVQFIDWKVFARTDQLTLREHRDEAASHVVLITDFSESMHWPESNSQHPMKSEIAVRLAAWLAATHVTMGDRVSWFGIDGGRATHLLDSPVVGFFGPQSTQDLVAMFELNLKRLVEGFKEQMANRLQEQFKNMNLRDLFHQQRIDSFWILSDGIGSGVESQWDQLINIKMDPLLDRKKMSFIHVLSELELEPSWVNADVCYVDQLPERIEYLGKHLLSDGAIWNEITRWRQGVESKSQAVGWKYFVATPWTPVDLFLKFIAERS
jgi:hypothetical protein